MLIRKNKDLIIKSIKIKKLIKKCYAIIFKNDQNINK